MTKQLGIKVATPRRRLAMAVTFGAMMLWGALAHAQAFPNRPIRLIVPYPAGNAADTQARLIAEKLAASLRQPVLVDNRAGASGQIGITAVARSAPDGYTLVMGQLGAFAVAPHTYKNVPYDVRRDFVPVAQVSSNYLVLFANGKLPVNTLQELLAAARKNPGKYSFGTNGEGGLPHLMMELLMAETGVKLTHVPYKGVGQIATDLIAGQIDLALDSYSGMISYTKDGRLKALASSAGKRMAEAPNLPTFKESGVPNYEVHGFFGIFAPSGTPPQIVSALNSAINDAVQKPDVQEKLRTLGYEPVTGTPEAFGKTFQAAYDTWRQVVKSIGFVPQ